MEILDRNERIAELLLKECELENIERVSPCVSFNEVTAVFDSYEIPLTPIEKVMFAILKRVCERIQDSYGLILNFKPQAKVDNYRLDFCLCGRCGYELEHVAIECDGHNFHEKTKEQAKHDKERDRYLTKKGYKILRFTGSEIYNDFDRIEKEIEDMCDPTSDNCIFSWRC